MKERTELTEKQKTREKNLKKWTKGVSGNPNGMRKGFAGLAAEIRNRTADGSELVTIALSIARGQPVKMQTKGRPVVRIPDFKDKMEAVKWLADRGFGKALQSIELTGLNGGAIKLEGRTDLSKLTTEELRQVIAIYELAEARTIAESAAIPAQLVPAEADPANDPTSED
jgi:hypothetical protein